MTSTTLQALLQRDRLTILAGLAGTTGLAWAYLLAMAADMGEMSGSIPDMMLTGRATPWTATHFVMMFSMWAIMMVGMMLPSAALGGATLIGAGVYQWTPLKSACLHHCQSPLQFISQYWQPGPRGALRMGVAHGLYCLGCCWILMCLLFVGGVMNLLWIAGLAGFVFLEKVLASRWVPVGSGVVLVVWGTLVLARAG